jgi:L-2-hydroxyglutarate oxidase LhgO
VVARTAADHPQMDDLLGRGAANGVTLESITEAEARRIEPRVKTCERAIWSPNTATADPGGVIAAMREDAEREGVRFALGTAFRRRRGNEMETSQGRWSAGYVVNCAGLQADRIAKQFGFSDKATPLLSIARACLTAASANETIQGTHRRPGDRRQAPPRGAMASANVQQSPGGQK